MSVFRYRNQYYWDTFFDGNGWPDFDGKRKKDKSLPAHLAVFLRQQGRTRQMCEYVYDESSAKPRSDPGARTRPVGLRLIFLGRQDLPALVHAGFEIDVVRPTQFARVLVLDVAVGRQGMMRAPHIAPGRRDFAFGDGHWVSSEGWK